MSISETNKIDLIARDPNSAIVKLVIADHLTWDDLDAHSQLLQNKINAYLEFVASGQLEQIKKPVIPESPEIRITLAMKHKPTTDVLAFLAGAEAFLAGIGVKLELEQPSEG